MSNANFLDLAKYSLSVAVYREVRDYIITKDDDHFVTKVAKITANFIAAPVFALAMLVESVVRALLSIPAKFIHLFLPYSLAKGFKEHVLRPLALGSAFSAQGVANTLASLMTNFFSENAKEKMTEAIHEMTEEAYELFKPAIKYHFFK